MEKRNSMLIRKAANRHSTAIQSKASAFKWLTRRNAFAKKANLPRLRTK